MPHLNNKNSKRLSIGLGLAFAGLLFLIAIKIHAETNSFDNSKDSKSVTEKTTEKSILIKMEKNRENYSLQEPMKIIEGAKSGYINDYQIYKGKLHNSHILSFSGKILGYFPAEDLLIKKCLDYFDPDAVDRGGCEELAEGNIEIRIPYFPNGRYAEFYNLKSEKFLTLDISSLTSCNENNFCDKDMENYETCPTDCPLENQKSRWILYVLIGIFVLLTGAGIFFWIKKRNRR